MSWNFDWDSIFDIVLSQNDCLDHKSQISLFLDRFEYFFFFDLEIRWGFQIRYFELRFYECCHSCFYVVKETFNLWYYCTNCENIIQYRWSDKRTIFSSIGLKYPFNLWNNVIFNNGKIKTVMILFIKHCLLYYIQRQDVFLGKIFIIKFLSIYEYK